MATFLELQFSLDFRFSVIYSGSGTGALIVGFSHFSGVHLVLHYFLLFPLTIIAGENIKTRTICRQGQF